MLIWITIWASVANAGILKPDVTRGALDRAAPAAREPAEATGRGPQPRKDNVLKLDLSEPADATRGVSSDPPPERIWRPKPPDLHEVDYSEE